MARNTWIYDRPTGEVVTKAEHARRQAERAASAPAHEVPDFLNHAPIRGTWLWYRGDWVDRALFSGEMRPRAPAILRDYEPFRSMADGSIVDGRAARREHMRRHNLIEVGNEKPDLTPRKPVPAKKVRQSIKEVKERWESGNLEPQPRSDTVAVGADGWREAG